jgi:glycosyltransferase involved in cell wall biosynthesis
MTNNLGIKKKILFVHHGKGIGGAPISLLYTIQQLKFYDYTVKVLFIFNSDVVNIFSENNIETKVIQSAFYKKFYKYFAHSEAGFIKWYQIIKLFRVFISWVISAFFLSSKYLKKEKPDIIHINSSVLSDWAFAAKRLNIKTICHIREPIANGYFGLRKTILRKLFDYSANHIIAISEDNARRINLPKKTTVIYNFVDFKYFNKDITGTIQNKNNKKYILYLGGFSKLKGFHILVESLKYLDKDIKVLFAGYYPKILLNSFKRKIKYLLLFSYRKWNSSMHTMQKSNNTLEIGVSTNIPDLIASSEAVVFPSTKPHFARPIIEAQAMAKPAIASDVQGMDEIIEHNKTGLLVKKNDAKALAIAINTLCSNKQLREKMGEKSYLNAKKYFSSLNINKIINIYNNI